MVSLEFSLRPHYVPEVDSASNRNEYQEYFLWGKGGRCVGLTNLPPSCADFLEFWKPQPPGTLGACPGLYRDCFTSTYWVKRWVGPRAGLNTVARHQESLPDCSVAQALVATTLEINISEPFH